ncbi:hypothetical protein AHF37_01387 [Paragonimus kellicotti]|nr:hypothetical protein AHF37_01387 [Paragonimus kellicotti]
MRTSRVDFSWNPSSVNVAHNSSFYKMTSPGSCIEKTVSTEPLILRPPVGAEVYGQPRVWFRSPFASGPNQGGRRRLFYHCLLSTLLALIAVIMVLVILFILGVSPFSSEHHPLYGSHLSQQSMCRVFIPVLKLQMTELISADDNMFNVTVFGGALTGIHTLRILHLCKDGLTVIRTNERCYIRPMGRDWRRVCSNGYLRNLQNGHGLQTSVEARLTDELWFMEQPIPETIRNSHISAWCEGVPAFRLLSNQPSEGFSIDPLIMATSRMTHHLWFEFPVTQMRRNYTAKLADKVFSLNVATWLLAFSRVLHWTTKVARRLLQGTR